MKQIERFGADHLAVVVEGVADQEIEDFERGDCGGCDECHQSDALVHENEI